MTVFTDVTADEAVDGRDGFNFQGISADVPAAALSQIRTSLLHVVDPAWPADRDAEEHPETCAYVVADGLRYLSRGRSSGRTNSGRPGNQITQTIVSADDDDFLPYRPAQLFGAANWQLDKAPSAGPSPWITPLDVDATFEAEGLRDFVRNDPWLTDVLASYVEHFLQAASTPSGKLVLIHSDLNAIMKWVALGSLFLGPECLDVEFRALVSNPRQRGNIVGLSPEFRSGPVSGLPVADLEQRTLTPIEVTPIVAAMTSWFLEADWSESSTAINLARRWRADLGDDTTNAVVLTVLGGASLSPEMAWTTAVALVANPAPSIADGVDVYIDEITDAIIGHEPVGAAAFTAGAEALRRTSDPSLANALVLQLVDMSVREPELKRLLVEELPTLPQPFTWVSAEDQAVASESLGQLLKDAPDDALAGLLGVVTLTGTTLAAADEARVFDRLVAETLRMPTATSAEVERWPSREEVVAALGDQLLEAFRDDDSVQLAHLTAGRWTFLTPFVVVPALASWLYAGELAQLAPDLRLKGVLEAKFDPKAWQVALHGAELPGHAALLAAWLEQNNFTSQLRGVIADQLDEALDEPAWRGDAKQLTAWDPLITALAKTDLSPAWRDRLERFEQRKKDGSFGGHMKKASGAFGKRWSKQSPDDLTDSGELR